MVHIYGTLGPACDSAETLAQMLTAGMTGVRLNLSHETLQDAKPILDKLQEASALAHVSPELLIDLQGPELRVGMFPQPLSLVPDTLVDLKTLSLPQEAQDRMAKGQEILLDDGKILLIAESNDSCRVVRGGILRSRKSVALPGMEIHMPPLTPADLDNLRDVPAMGVTGVMQPFVRGRDDLLALRHALDAAGGQAIRILAKIENRQGMAALPELIPECDEIVIARGDLGNAMPLFSLPAAQKRIAAACRSAGKHFMVVTQMLASMEHSPVPTRAEVSDIFNAVLDGASSVMVTGETAVGDYPVESIRWLAQTAAEAERYRNNDDFNTSIFM